MNYQNPIIAGFHPDPSICRVGEDYYLVNSSFEYFPGVPIFHSRDLQHWTQIGHCLTRPSQLPLKRTPSSGGIYAPTIRHHDGTFYMVTTNVSAGGNFFVTADDPAGDWSEPIWVEQGGIDPSLFFDVDGKVYFTSTSPDDPQRGAIIQSEIDVRTGKLLTEPREIWEGTGGQYPEAPHLYKINGLFYLMIAEGGTDWGHMETMARSDSPWGPFIPCPHNPILTNRSTCRPIQNTGHADLVQAKDDCWWLVFLGTRPIWNWHHLGRETFLAPVQWTSEGWPLVGDNGHASLSFSADGPTTVPGPERVEIDDFDDPVPAPYWNFLRNPHDDNWSLTDRPGSLTLNGSAVTLDDVDSPAFLGRRQEHFECRVSALLDFQPVQHYEEAGLTILMNERHHYDIAVIRLCDQRCVIGRRRIGSLSAIDFTQKIEDGPVELRVRAKHDMYYGEIVQRGEAKPVLQGETRYLSKEVAGGFTGVYFGLYATGNGKQSVSPAYFDWFRYEVKEEV